MMSDIGVVVVLYSAGAYTYAAISITLLIGQFVVVYLRVLPCPLP